MFKYTKRLLSDIRFWYQEVKLRSKENAEWVEGQGVDCQIGCVYSQIILSYTEKGCHIER